MRRKDINRIPARLLAAVLALTLLSVPALAAEILPVSPADVPAGEPDSMARPAAEPSEIPAGGVSGACGDHLTWTLTEDGTLTISGEGDMDDFATGSWAAPWQSYAGSLKKAILSDGVTGIGKSAFLGCSELSEVTIGSGVTTIRDSAFQGTGLLHAVIPDSVTELGRSAFLECKSLADVSIGSGVTTLGYLAFAKCENLAAVTVSPDNPVLRGVDGVLFGDGGKELVVYPAMKTDTAYEIPAGVTTIDANAFRNAANLTSLVIPDGVERIGEYAFYQCTGLTTVTLPGSANAQGRELFTGCKNLKAVILGEGMTKIDACAFEYCPFQSVVIPVSMIRIEVSAFEFCSRLTDVYYMGTEEQWNGIVVGWYNTALLNAALHFGAPDDHFAITGHPQNATGVVGGTVGFHVSASGEAPAYRWQLRTPTSDWMNLGSSFTGWNTDTLTVPVIAARNNFRYRCLVTCGGETLTSGSAVLKVFSITEQPQNAVGIVGNTVDFHVTVQGDGIGYRWQLKTPTGDWINLGTNFEGWNTDTLTVPVIAARNNFRYRCLVTFGGVTLTSDSAALTVSPPFEITEQPRDTAGVPDENAVFHVGVTGLDLSYQWQIRTGTDASFVDLDSRFEGWNTDTLTVPVTMENDGAQFRCLITCGGKTLVSENAALTVFAVVRQPQDAAVTAGGQAIFYAAATVTEGVTYLWEVSCPGEDWVELNFFTKGYDTDTLSVWSAVNRHENRYRCRMTFGNVTLFTDPAELTVLAVREQPRDVIGLPGENAVFHVDTPSGVSHQWQFRTPTGYWMNLGTGMEGSRTETLTVPVISARDGFRYRCRVSFSDTVQFSDEAMLSVLSFREQPTDTDGVIGESVSFHAEAVCSGAAYRWQFKKPGGDWMYLGSTFAGYNAETLTVPVIAARNGFEYRCRVTLGGRHVFSESVALTAVSFSVTGHPEDVTAAVGTNVTFHAAAVGSGLTYRWQFKKPGGDWMYLGSTFKGYNAKTLTMPVIAARNSFEYRCRITCGNQSLFTEAATLTVFAITSQPRDMAGAVGTDAVFSVTVRGGDSAVYRWQFKKPDGSWMNLGTTFVGVKTDTLTVPVIRARNGFQYRCLVTLDGVTVISSAAVLTVE